MKMDKNVQFEQYYYTTSNTKGGYGLVASSLASEDYQLNKINVPIIPVDASSLGVDSIRVICNNEKIYLVSVRGANNSDEKDRSCTFYHYYEYLGKDYDPSKYLSAFCGHFEYIYNSKAKPKFKTGNFEEIDLPKLCERKEYRIFQENQNITARLLNTLYDSFINRKRGFALVIAPEENTFESITKKSCEIMAIIYTLIPEEFRKTKNFISDSNGKLLPNYYFNCTVKIDRLSLHCTEYWSRIVDKSEDFVPKDLLGLVCYAFACLSLSDYTNLIDKNSDLIMKVFKHLSIAQQLLPVVLFPKVIQSLSDQNNFNPNSFGLKSESIFKELETVLNYIKPNSNLNDTEICDCFITCVIYFLNLLSPDDYDIGFAFVKKLYILLITADKAASEEDNKRAVRIFAELLSPIKEHYVNKIKAEFPNFEKWAGDYGLAQKTACYDKTSAPKKENLKAIWRDTNLKQDLKAYTYELAKRSYEDEFKTNTEEYVKYFELSDEENDEFKKQVWVVYEEKNLNIKSLEDKITAIKWLHKDLFEKNAKQLWSNLTKEKYQKDDLLNLIFKESNEFSMLFNYVYGNNTFAEQYTQISPLFKHLSSFSFNNFFIDYIFEYADEPKRWDPFSDYTVIDDKNVREELKKNIIIPLCKKLIESNSPKKILICSVLRKHIIESEYERPIQISGTTYNFDCFDKISSSELSDVFSFAKDANIIDLVNNCAKLSTTSCGYIALSILCQLEIERNKCQQSLAGPWEEVRNDSLKRYIEQLKEKSSETISRVLSLFSELEDNDIKTLVDMFNSTEIKYELQKISPEPESKPESKPPSIDTNWFEHMLKSLKDNTRSDSGKLPEEEIKYFEILSRYGFLKYQHIDYLKKTYHSYLDELLTIIKDVMKSEMENGRNKLLGRYIKQTENQLLDYYIELIKNNSKDKPSEKSKNDFLCGFEDKEKEYFESLWNKKVESLWNKKVFKWSRKKTFIIILVCLFALVLIITAATVAFFHDKPFEMWNHDGSTPDSISTITDESVFMTTLNSQIESTETLTGLSYHNVLQRLTDMKEQGNEKIRFNPPTKDKAINDFEKENHDYFPNEYSELLKITNGCTILGKDKDTQFYGINSKDEYSLQSQNSDQNLGKYSIPSSFYIVGNRSSGDLLCINSNNQFIQWDYAMDTEYKSWDSLFDYIDEEIG